MITIKKQKYGHFIFHGTTEVYDYFEPYMDKEIFIDYFSSCLKPIDEFNSFTMVPSNHEFSKRDWKIVVKGFAHFGVDIENLEETA